MNAIIAQSSCALPLPAPRVAITIRPGELSDIPFLDQLQKLHTKQVGWMPTAQFEGKIKLGHVLIAEDAGKKPLGYVIGNDQYFKHDDLGIIYQLNVAPAKQRGFIGASLLRAMFDKSAWGCKLFCCWCAQDIEANHFWESMGFVPLAFRAGSAKKSRIHIFWQKRIREGDTTTPWWFPSQTNGGAIREDRLVLPIPPDTHWSDAKPVVLPGERSADALPAPKEKKKRIRAGEMSTVRGEIREGLAAGGLHVGVPRENAIVVRSKREKKPRQKNDPKYVAAARELRDRYLENVNHNQLQSQGKYDVRRMIASDRPAPCQLLIDAA